MLKIDVEQISNRKMFYIEIGGSYQLKVDFKMRLPSHPSLPVKLREGGQVRYGTYATISPSGWLYLGKGCVSNGADYAIDTSSLIRAFFVHDALLYIIGAGLLDYHEWKPYTDALFTAISEKDGVPWWRRWYQSIAVRRIGRKKGSIAIKVKKAP